MPGRLETMRDLALAIVPMLALALSGCSSPPPPPLQQPTLSEALLSGMEADVHRQIIQAYQAARESPSDSQRNGRVGMLLHAYGHVESAADFYLYAISQSPSEFRWIYYLGLAEQAAGQRESAAESFRLALSLQPDNPSAKLQLATTLIDLNLAQESVPHLQEIVKRQPANPLAHYNLGRAFTRLARDDDALKSLSRACQLAPDFGAAQYALALAHRGRGDQQRYEHHVALFEKHKDSRPSDDDPLQREVWRLREGVSVLLEKGRQLQDLGRDEEAIAEYRKVLLVRPEHGMAHASLMGLYRHLGRLDEGEAQYQTVLEVNPDIPEVHYNYGFLLLDRGQPEEAVAAFERALELNPSYADAHANLAVLLAGLEQNSGAVVHLRKALEIDQNHRLARYNLARMLLQKGETSESILLLSGALSEEDSETAQIEALLTTASAMAGQWEKAKGHGRRALELSQKYEQVDLARTARYDLGRILFQSGSYGEAIDLLAPGADSEDESTPALLLLLASSYSRVGNQELASQHAARALTLARRYGQGELVARIERALGEAGGGQ